LGDDESLLFNRNYFDKINHKFLKSDEFIVANVQNNEDLISNEFEDLILVGNECEEELKKIEEENLIKENITKFTAQCRICYYKESDEENPLVSLCNCIGSVRYIHYSCLETWITSRLTFKEKNNVFIVKCKFYCELCKTPLPSKILF
jgi:hypothetical protein